MGNSLLDFISTKTGDDFITDRWANNKTGKIVDIENDNYFRFVEYATNDYGLIKKYISKEDELTCPIVCGGIIGYWLHWKNDLCIKDIFDEYYNLKMRQYESTHQYDADAWERNLKKEFVTKYHIESEKTEISDSEAIFEYLSVSDTNKIKNIGRNYLKYARKRKKELYISEYPSNKIIEQTFFAVYNDGGASECIRWFRDEYNLSSMGGHWAFSNGKDKLQLDGLWKEWHDVEAPQYIQDESDDFDESVLTLSDGGLMDEIDNNLAQCSSDKDRIRYIVSILQQFYEFADAFYPESRVAERKQAIIQKLKYKAVFEKMPDDAVNDYSRESICPKEQIAAIEDIIDKYNKDIEYWKYVGDMFYQFAQRGLNGKFLPEDNPLMCKCLGSWWLLMITFSRRLAALSLSYGIKLPDVQKLCGIYINWTYDVTDYVDYKYVTSIEHAKSLLAKVEKEQINNVLEKNDSAVNNFECLFPSNSCFDAWVCLSQFIRNAKKSIILIDNYMDERILSLLSKRTENVSAKVFTRYNKAFMTDLEKFNKQYRDKQVEYQQLSKSVHDRFLIVDDMVYHLGASAKDIGSSLCVIVKMYIAPSQILDNL